MPPRGNEIAPGRRRCGVLGGGGVSLDQNVVGCAIYEKMNDSACRFISFFLIEFRKELNWGKSIIDVK